jgi:hypothetical protein
MDTLGCTDSTGRHAECPYARTPFNIDIDVTLSRFSSSTTMPRTIVGLCRGVFTRIPKRNPSGVALLKNQGVSWLMYRTTLDVLIVVVVVDVEVEEVVDVEVVELVLL